MIKLSIIIPVYNEERTIREVLRKVNSVKIPNFEKEIIVVDDASKDFSLKEIKDAKVKYKIKNLKILRHKKNMGKGASIKSGLKKAMGDVVLIQDADLEYDPKYYKKLLKPILKKKASVVYGSRLKNYPLKLFGKNKTPLIMHFLGNKFLTFVTNMLYGESTTDMETGYKVFKKSILKEIEIKSKRFDFEAEVTAKILKKGYKIYEVPIKIKPRGYNEGKKITWKDGIWALFTLIKYRFVD